MSRNVRSVLSSCSVTDWLTDASREINAVLKSRVPSRRFLPTSVSQSPSSSCPPETLGFSDARASELMRLLRTAIERIVSEIRSEWLQRDSLREASVAASLRSQNDTSSAGSPRDSADGARSENIRSSNVLPGSPSTAPVAEEMDLPNCNRCPGNAHGRVAFPGHLWGLALTGGACNAFFGAPSCRLIFQGVPSLPTNSTDRQEADTQIGNEKNAPLICAPTTVGERRTGVGRLPPGWQEVEGLHQWSLAHSYGADGESCPSNSLPVCRLCFAYSDERSPLRRLGRARLNTATLWLGKPRTTRVPSFHSAALLMKKVAAAFSSNM